MNISEMLGKAMGSNTKKRNITVKDSFEVLLTEESDKLLDNDQVVDEAVKLTENNGIVFLDEIDKISCARESACRRRGYKS